MSYLRPEYLGLKGFFFTETGLYLRPEYLGLNGSFLPIIQISSLVTVYIENS